MPATAVERVEVRVLVDTATDLLSTVHSSVTPEIPSLLAAGMRELSGEALCCAHWGLSLLITAHAGGRPRTVLFDAGPEGAALERNADRLRLDLGEVEAVVLSHGHWDHAGGLLAALARIRAGRPGGALAVHVNRDMFRSRGLTLPDGRVVPFADIPSPDALAGAGGEVVSDPAERLLLDGAFFLSGEIPRVTAYEKGRPGHLARAGPRAPWEPDPWILDERFLAVRVEGRGVLVFTGCSHAGVVNVLLHARERLGPLYAVMGGFHLSGPGSEAIIADTVRDLAQFGLRWIVPGHCTGWRAVHALVEAFGEAVVVPSAVGRLHAF